MRKTSFIFLIGYLSMLGLHSQAVESERLKVMIDCRGCDQTYIRQNITVVDHVRDLSLADVYILINRTWSGGSVLYQIDLTGKKTFEKVNNNFQFDVSTTLTDNERRDELVRVISTALSPYLLHTQLSKKISVELPEVKLEESIAVAEDPWNNWVFELSGNLSARSQDTRNEANVSFGAEGDKVTEEWRVRMDMWYNRNSLIIEEDSSIFTSLRENRFVGGSIVNSWSDHWSIGFFTSYMSNTVSNIGKRNELSPAIEYSFFNYKDVLTREVTLSYRVGYMYQEYLETTIFDTDFDHLLNQNLSLNIRFRKPWGTVSSRINGNMFLNQLENYRISMDNFFSVRVFQGFSVRFNGDFSIIRDQVNLAKGDASLEDVILQQRAIATGYQLNVGVGLSYTFGSIYNNILNTRL